jgi:hypothetical protein
MKKSFFLFLFLSSYLFAKEEVIMSTLKKNSPDSRTSPSVYCLIEEKKKYQGFSYRISGKNLFFDEEPKIDANQTYILTGTWKKDLTERIKELGTCEQEEVREQIRSDWLAEENRESGRLEFISWGVGETTRKRLQELSYFHVTKIKKLDAIKCKMKPKVVQLEILPIPEWKGVQIMMVSHYEGGRGKPQPKYLNQKVRLKKQKILLDIPKTIKETGRDFQLQNIILSGERKNVSINVDINMALCK